MSKSRAMDLVAQFMGRQNTIPIPVPFVHLTGDYAAAAFLSQCLYWGERTEDPDGWFYKSHPEWEAELMLSSDQVRRCVKSCAGMVEVKRAGIPARNYYRVNSELVTDALILLANDRQTGTARYGETQQLAVGKPNSRPQTNPTASHTADPISIYRTEITTEPTTEQKDSPAVAGSEQAEARPIKQTATPNTETAAPPVQESNTGKASSLNNTEALDKVPGGAASEKNEKEAHPDFQAMFDAIWPAFRDLKARGLTALIGRRANEALDVGHTPADVSRAVAWALGDDWESARLTPTSFPAMLVKWQSANRSRAAAPAPSPAVRSDAPVDMDALIRNAPLNGTRRKS